MVAIASSWWLFLVRGIFLILFGVLTFVMPGMALLTLVYLFGFLALLDGSLSMGASVNKKRGRPSARGETAWMPLSLQGVVGIVAGVLTLLVPGLTALALLYLIAGWALAGGIFAIIAAVRLRKEIRGEWALALSGVLSIVLGVLLALFPAPGVLAVVLWVGAFAIASGVLMLVLASRLRKVKKQGGVPTMATPPMGEHGMPAGSRS